MQTHVYVEQPKIISEFGDYFLVQIPKNQIDKFQVDHSSYVLSESVLKDWLDPKEDEAWKNL